MAGSNEGIFDWDLVSDRVYVSYRAQELFGLPRGELWRPRFFNRGIAVHGSQNIPPWPDSHGCARLSNAAIDMVWAADLMPVGSRVLDIFQNVSQPQNTGHLFMALHIDRFVPLAQFKQEADRFIRELKESNKAQGTDAILMPGEREYGLRDARRRDGIPMSLEVMEQIGRVAEGCGVRTAAWHAVDA